MNWRRLGPLGERLGLAAVAATAAALVGSATVTKADRDPAPLLARPAPFLFQPSCRLGDISPDGLTALERALKSAVLDARFQDVIDFGPLADEAKFT